MTASTVVLKVRGFGGAVGRNGRLVWVVAGRAGRFDEAELLRRDTGATWGSRGGLGACPTWVIEMTLDDELGVKRERCTAAGADTISTESSAG